MGAGEYLTTLERVKSVLGIKATEDADDKLRVWIRNASAAALNFCNRERFAKSLYTESYDGTGKDWLTLRQPDPLSIFALSIMGVPIPPATGDGISSPYSNGYRLDRDRVFLHGRVFPTSRSSVYVAYYAGFEVSETVTVPDTPFKVDASQMWLADGGVTIGGSPLLKVAADPDVGEYAVSDGEYVFNSAAADSAATLTYGYAPADVEEAVSALVAERYRWKDRIGVNNKALGGQETVSFSANQLPTYVKELLSNYRRVI